MKPTQITHTKERRAAKPMLPYTPAPGVPLSPVNETMSITCHASPDAGWIELSKFLQNIQQQLTVGMYDTGYALYSGCHCNGNPRMVSHLRDSPSVDMERGPRLPPAAGGGRIACRDTAMYGG